jgi:type I restriction enzyme, S subunit
VKDAKAGYTPFADGDVIFAKITPCMENGKAAVVVGLKNGLGFGSTEFHVARPLGGVSSGYVFRFLVQRSYRRNAERKMSGSAGQLLVPKSFFSESVLPLPPLPEQHRIVAKIEELFSSLDKGVEDLKTAQQRLKVYRQAVLKWAFEGKLTEKWRKRQGPLPVGSQVFELIKAERRKQAEASGRELKSATPIIEPKLSELPRLPEEWCWVTPSILAAFDSNAICAGPFGTIFKAKDSRDKGIPIIFLRHVKAGQYKTDKPGFMDTKKWKESSASYSVFGGELLITKLGDPPGECALYPTGIGPAMVTPDIIKMSSNEAIVVPKFLMYYFNSEVYRRLSEDAAFGTTRLRLTIPMFRDSPTVFCSIEEQKQIVQEIESRLSVADKIEETITDSLKQAESLRQSTLKKAFKGKPVPQDPNDEPATATFGADHSRKKHR